MQQYTAVHAWPPQQRQKIEKVIPHSKRHKPNSDAYPKIGSV